MGFNIWPQRRLAITSSLCIMWHFRSFITFLSLHISSSAPLLHEVYSGIRLGTASIHHNRSISRLTLANSTIWYFVHMTSSGLTKDWATCCKLNMAEYIDKHSGKYSLFIFACCIEALQLHADVSVFGTVNSWKVPMKWIDSTFSKLYYFAC